MDYKEHDFSMAPQILTPLVDRTVVAGYSTALNCAVRGHPKVHSPSWSGTLHPKFSYPLGSGEGTNTLNLVT